MPIAPHAAFSKMNGVIPGEGLTKPVGSAPYQQPPQFVHLDDLLEHIWDKFNDPDHTVKLYGLLKAGLPAEAIARTVLFGAFCHGVCTPSLAMMAFKTVVKQIVAIGHFMGVTKINIKNPDKNKVRDLARIARAMDDRNDTTGTDNATSSGNVFTGIGM